MFPTAINGHEWISYTISVDDSIGNDTMDLIGNQIDPSVTMTDASV